MVTEQIISDVFQPNIWRHSPHGNNSNAWVHLMARLAIRIANCFVYHPAHRSCTAISSNIERLDPNTWISHPAEQFARLEIIVLDVSSQEKVSLVAYGIRSWPGSVLTPHDDPHRESCPNHLLIIWLSKRASAPL